MTTDSSGPVRAVARVGVGGTPAPANSAAATLSPRRRPGHLGPVHVLQLFLVEAALLGLLAVLNQGIVLIAGVAVAGIVLLALVLGRQSGRWWLERRVLTWHFKRRTEQRPPARSADMRLTALRTLAPRLTVEEVPVANDSVIGVARDDAGWFAVAEIAPKAAMADGPFDGVPLDVLVNALTDAGQPGATLQVVTHTVTAPSLDLPAALPAAYSYRELLQRFGPVPIPVDRLTWVAVRLDARALAEAGADSAEQAPAVVAAMLRKLAKTLRRTGVGVRILDRDGLLTALERSCDLQRPDDVAPPHQPREDWSAWHSGGLAHRSYWVRDWPSVAQAGALVDWLAAAPAALTSVAFIIVPGGGGSAAETRTPGEPEEGAEIGETRRNDPLDSVDLRCLVRVAAPPAQLAEVCQAVDRGAHVAHAQLFALDGEQGPATYATAPTGGGPR